MKRGPIKKPSRRSISRQGIRGIWGGGWKDDEVESGQGACVATSLALVCPLMSVIHAIRISLATGGRVEEYQHRSCLLYNQSIHDSISKSLFYALQTYGHRRQIQCITRSVTMRNCRYFRQLLFHRRFQSEVKSLLCQFLKT